MPPGLNQPNHICSCSHDYSRGKGTGLHAGCLYHTYGKGRQSLDLPPSASAFVLQQSWLHLTLDYHSQPDIWKEPVNPCDYRKYLRVHKPLQFSEVLVFSTHSVLKLPHSKVESYSYRLQKEGKRNQEGDFYLAPGNGVLIWNEHVKNCLVQLPASHLSLFIRFLISSWAC